MSPPRFILYIAVSLDGYIARANGAVDWLEHYDPSNFGYEAFAAGIETVIMGRKTYQQALSFGEWPYQGKRIYVLSSNPLQPSTPQTSVFDMRELPALAQRLQSESRGDIWIMGGSQTACAFLQQQLLDRIELYLIPVLLGEGIPLFAQATLAETPLRLIDCQAFDDNVVRLVYEPMGQSNEKVES